MRQAIFNIITTCRQAKMVVKNRFAASRTALEVSAVDRGRKDDTAGAEASPAAHHSLLKRDFLLQKILENATEGKRKGWLLRVAAELKELDKLLIADFINDLQNTENIRFGTRRVYIMNSFYLARSAEARHSKEPSILKAMTKDDIEAYLYGHCKSIAADPDEGWISSYNQRLTTFLKFYKWLHSAHILPSCLRPKPSILEGIRTGGISRGSICLSSFSV
jgi:hypothetical protein